MLVSRKSTRHAWQYTPKSRGVNTLYPSSVMSLLVHQAIRFWEYPVASKTLSSSAFEPKGVSKAPSSSVFALRVASEARPVASRARASGVFEGTVASKTMLSSAQWPRRHLEATDSSAQRPRRRAHAGILEFSRVFSVFSHCEARKARKLGSSESAREARESEPEP